VSRAKRGADVCAFALMHAHIFIGTARHCPYPSNPTPSCISQTNLSGSNLREVVMSKAYAVKANFKGADFTNAVVDRVAFDGANLAGAQFNNAVRKSGAGCRCVQGMVLARSCC
jgi:uncharacterized protein YjbI with pentapeptide repeats